ncbi:MAG: cupin domain-containing protein [Bacteroidetes bacterium]|nr:cupin domain-containing protein [Bacteroidota bacterium]
MNIRNFLFAALPTLFILILFQEVIAQPVFPDFPPSDVTNQMDRDQMLEQLGITLPVLPSKLEDPNAPSDAFPADSLNPEGNWTDSSGHTITRSAWGLWNNYDDRSVGFFPGKDSFRLGSYSPINLLQLNNGKIIATSDEWWNERRPEILEDVQETLYGAIPAKENWPEIKWEVKTRVGGNGGNRYIQKEITGVIDVSAYPEVREKPLIKATLRLPQEATMAVPVLIKIGGGFGNPMETLWNEAYPNGWGVCIFNPTALQPDNGAGLTSYLIGLLNKGNWRKPSDWGTLVAWSWGISRLIDHFETDPQVDAGNIGLTGHSRYGKATLLTMAYEPRIAIGFPSDAGSLGTTLTRRHWGQDLENSTGANEYHWMAGNFFKWAGELNEGDYLPRKIEDCPVDAHSLLALCAPRPVLHNGGTQSSWTDPYGQYLTTVLASPVYELLGAKGMIMNELKPLVDSAYIEGDLAYRYHEGGHTDAPEWPTFFRFSAKYIPAPVLRSSMNYVMVDHRGDQDMILEVQSNSQWTEAIAERWIKTDRQGDSLLLTIKPNKDPEGRSSILTLTNQGRKKQIRINQTSVTPRLQVVNPRISISGEDGASAIFEIRSNTAWSISSSESWVNFIQNSGANNELIEIITEANPRVEKRTATIAISSPGLVDRQVILTQGEGEPELRVFTNILEVGNQENSSAGTWLIANGPCEVEADDSWLKTEISENNRFTRLTVTAEKNITLEERKAIISVKLADLEPQKVVVIQKPGDRAELITVDSKVYAWAALPVEEKETGPRRQILDGGTTHLERLEIHATTLKANLAPHPPHVHDDEEELLIVKQGQVEVDIEGKKTVLGPGSIALIMPGDNHGFHNAGDEEASYYVIKYRSRNGADHERGKESGGSFTVNWDSVEFREHDKGARADFFNRPTTMCENFEMHVTQLKENTASHDPHTHDVEEIILMIQGEIEMHIDGETPKAVIGDLVFLDSQVPHAPTNIGKGRAIYFAFQWK